MEFKTTTSSPYLEPENQVSAMMRQVLYALVPGTIAATWYFGWGVLINVLLAIIFAVTLEAAAALIRSRDPMPWLKDYSAIVTAWLLGLSIPQLAPWWVTFTGILFAIIIAKQLYGGLGFNPFNPAMVGYVVLLISFPEYMTKWVTPTSLAADPASLFETIKIIFTGQMPVGMSWDSLTTATPLDTLKAELQSHKTVSEIRLNPIFSSMGGIGWEWVANWFMLGGFWLIYKKIIPWQIPLTVMLSLGIPAGLFYLSNPDHFASPIFHIFSGGAILGAFFIATDPVSGSATPRGRIIFAIGVGLLTFIIRTWGGYPEAIAFSVLLMNMAVPLIDHYTQPKVFGKDHS